MKLGHLAGVASTRVNKQGPWKENEKEKPSCVALWQR